MKKLAHVVNPVLFPEGSQNYYAQQVAFETMILSREFARKDLEVELISVQYPEDHSIIPDLFECTTDLDRSVQDVAQFNKAKKLPLLKDIFEHAIQATDADFLIYTNVDICLMPYFYLTVTHLFDEGFDAFTINRRTISSQYQKIDSLPLMFSEVGEPHRGWDCFAFNRSLYPEIILGNICIGIPLVGLAMIANLIAHADNFLQLKQAHLTFHLGNDRVWHDRSNLEYEKHNRSEVLRILRALDEKIGGFDPKSPPGEYLRFHNNKTLAYIYDNILMRFYIPAKYTRSNRRLDR